MIKLIFLLLFFSINIFSQDYRVVSMGLGKASKKPKYEFSFNYPEIKDFKKNVTGMNMFNKHIKGIIQAANDSFDVWMRDWDTLSINHERGSYYEVSDSVFYKSNSVISVHFFEYDYFSGAAHPNNSSFTVNYDLQNFKALTLHDLLKTGWESKISEICIKSLMKQIYPDKSEDDEWIKSGAGPSDKNFRVFNITRQGLVITFVTYQVASYANGPSEVFIPYTEITGIINESSALKEVIR